MPIQLIAMDLDGTLLRSDHMTVSERNRNALQHASEKGVHLVLASGRTWVQLESVAQQVPSAQYALLSNGAAARDLHQGKRLFTFDFPWGDFQTLLSLLHRYEAVFETYCAGHSYLERRLIGRFHNESLPAAFIERLAARLTIVDDLEASLACCGGQNGRLPWKTRMSRHETRHGTKLHPMKRTAWRRRSSVMFYKIVLRESPFVKMAILSRVFYPFFSAGSLPKTLTKIQQTTTIKKDC